MERKRSTPAALAALALVITGTTAVLAEPATSAAGTWTITPHRKASDGDVLSAVSCPTVTSCFAVGSLLVGTTNYGVEKTLIEHWSGDHWSVMRSPTPSDAQYLGLTSMSCPSANRCYASGSYTTWTMDTKTLVEYWDGTRWRILRSLNPPATGRTTLTLSGISCPADDNCFAVGNDRSSRALIEHWNGSHWARMVSANPRRLAVYLNEVSCPSANSCWAVGHSGNYPQRALIEHWNGKAWVMKATPALSDSVQASLMSVSCPSTTSCFAVGATANRSGVWDTVVVRWKGTWGAWKVMRSTAPTSNRSLNAISCPSTRTCVAVGSQMFARSGLASTLVERWVQGSPWVTMRSPNPAGDAYLWGVSCAATANCFAVGDSSVDVNNGPYRGLMEQYG